MPRGVRNQPKAAITKRGASFSRDFIELVARHAALMERLSAFQVAVEAGAADREFDIWCGNWRALAKQIFDMPASPEALALQVLIATDAGSSGLVFPDTPERLRASARQVLADLLAE